MKKLFLALCIFLTSTAAFAHAPESDAAYRKQIHAFIDEWHEDAAKARLAYFDKIAPNGIYIGTDKTELWNREQFKAWAREFFERKSAWSFKAVKRNVYMSPDRKFIWFDELLDTQMGPCQASGVIRKTDNGFEIEHYQLSIAIPNEVAPEVTKLVSEAEARPNAKPKTRLDTKPKAKPESGPGPKPETKPGVKPEPKPETKPIAKLDTKQIAKPETRPAGKLPARDVAN